MSSRRELLKRSILGLGAVASIGMIPKTVQEQSTVEADDDWCELPTFRARDTMRASDMTKLTESIIQLQNEVSRLKRIVR